MPDYLNVVTTFAHALAASTIIVAAGLLLSREQ